MPPNTCAILSVVRSTVWPSVSVGLHHSPFQLRSRDIMTSDGGRLTPDVTQVSLPTPVPHDVATSPIHSEVNHVPVYHPLHWNGRPQGLDCRGVHRSRSWC